MKKGFTLIELLVVIGIIAILSVVVIVTLNPAQLLKQSRDSGRVSDMSTLKTALSLYLADVSSPDLDGSSNIGCIAHSSSLIPSSAGCTRFSAGTAATDTDLTVDGTGWIPVNLNAISSGSPIPQLPIDPVNNRTYFYAYRPDQTNLTFEINMLPESSKFSAGGSSDVTTWDGGNSSTLYEVGTDPGLDL